jgi:hypothetical protein
MAWALATCGMRGAAMRPVRMKCLKDGFMVASVGWSLLGTEMHRPKCE